MSFHFCCLVRLWLYSAFSMHYWTISQYYTQIHRTDCPNHLIVIDLGLFTWFVLSHIYVFCECKSRFLICSGCFFQLSYMTYCLKKMTPVSRGGKYVTGECVYVNAMWTYSKWITCLFLVLIQTDCCTCACLSLSQAILQKCNDCPKKSVRGTDPFYPSWRCNTL